MSWGRRALVALTLVLATCAPAVPDIFDECDLVISLEPPAARPGDTVVATGGPFSEAYDHVVQIGGVAAEVVAVERCLECLSCRENDPGLCLACGPCIDCDALCDACEPTLSFVVPDAVVPGSTTVIVLNAYGSSSAVPIEILGATDTSDTSDTSDTGIVDSAILDTGSARDSASDTGAVDTGFVDTATSLP